MVSYRFFKMKIVILTYESYQSGLIIHQVLHHYHNQVVGIIQSEVIIPGKACFKVCCYCLRRQG